MAASFGNGHASGLVDEGLRTLNRVRVVAMAIGDTATWKGAAPGDDEIDIIARDIRFGILENPVRHWLGGDAQKTALIDGLSIFLPEGERYFIRSLKHYSPKLKDKALAAEINGYSVQEAFHTREHEDYNRALARLGYDVETMEEPVRKTLRSDKIPVFRLAVTCAIEHLTATLSTVTLRNPQFLADAAPAYRRLWMWHALEELEHKAVALDVLDAATIKYSGFKRYMLRTMAFNAVAWTFLMITLRNIRLFAKADGLKTGPRFWLRLVWLLFGMPGYWRKCAPLVLKYYLPGFSPLNKDDDELIRKGRAWLYTEFMTLEAAKSAPHAAESL
jgi:predicted metal-dependent hydrolase